MVYAKFPFQTSRFFMKNIHEIYILYKSSDTKVTAHHILRLRNPRKTAGFLMPWRRDRKWTHEFHRCRGEWHSYLPGAYGECNTRNILW